MTLESHEAKRGPERREILDIIERHLPEGLEFEIQEEIYDGDNLWFISGMTTDGSREYTYQSRSKRTKEPVAPAVDVAYFVDGIPIGGDNIHYF